MTRGGDPVRPRSAAASALLAAAGSPRRSGASAFWVVLWVAGGCSPSSARSPRSSSSSEPFEPIDVVFRLVGGSFAACGLIAWRRRPDSRSGLLHDRHRLRASSCRPLLGPARLAARPDAGALAPRPLGRCSSSPLVLTFLTGGRLRTPGGPGPGRGRRSSSCSCSPRSGWCSPSRRATCCWSGRDARRRRRHRHRAAGAVPGHLGRHRRGGRRAVAGRVTARAGARCCPASPAPPACCSSAALLVVDLVAGVRSAGAALDRRPARWSRCRSRSSPGCCAPGWPAAGSPTCSAGCGRCGPAELQAALARVLGDPALLIAVPATPTGRFVDADGRRSRCPTPAADRSVAHRSTRDGERGRRPGLRPVAGRRPRARRGGRRRRPRSRWRTGSCTPRSTAGWPSCRRPGSGSSPPPTPSGAASSATCTTAPSSGWSRWRCSSR